MSGLVLKHPCDRCPAVHETAISVEDVKAGKLPPVEAAVRYELKAHGKVVASYRRLCTACEAAVSKAFEEISRKRTKKTSTRS